MEDFGRNCRCSGGALLTSLLASFTNVASQPFTKVTLQMSQSNVPTIPFVLPLYHKMEQHLTAVSTSWDKSFKIQHAAEKGLVKLRKYSVPAKGHHSYIIGTSELIFCSIYPIIRCLNCLFLVLHPCLRSHWFAATADPVDSAMQEEAICTAEVVFRYIAETYLETSTPPTTVTAPKPMAKPATRTPSFLASACSFQRPVTATSTTTISKRTLQEELADELDQYFRFEAAPMERESSEDCPDNGPSAQEVLLNPLVWWKVSTLFTMSVS